MDTKKGTKREYDREYYLAHKEQKRVYSKAYREIYQERDREKSIVRSKKNRDKNPEKYREYSRRYKREHPEYFKQYYIDNKEILSGKARARHLGLRIAAINAYGGKCACCGESRYEFLAIDHINGGGNQHRKGVGCGNTFYYWLKKNNYPNGFRILCHNCNTSHGFYGFCPHSEEYKEEKEPSKFVIEYRKSREDALSAYGAMCACCGETEKRFLCIDHINGGGGKHRKEKGVKGRFYKWLASNSYPKEFQVLCYNCNLAKGFYGKCPHSEE